MNSRSTITDKYGRAIFYGLTAEDISGDLSSFRIYFVAGDRHDGLIHISQPTEQVYHFIPSVTYEIVEGHSKYLSTNVEIDPPIRVIMTVKYRYEYQIFE